MVTLDDTLDLLYDEMDDLLEAGKFDLINAMLEKFPVADQHTVVLLGILSTTHVAAELLPARSGFFDRVREELEKTSPAVAADLLRGLLR